MIHITVRGGVVVEVKLSTNLPGHCVVTDYDNDASDDTYFFPVTEIKPLDAVKIYDKANGIRKRIRKEANELYKKKMKAKGAKFSWKDNGGEAI